MAASWLTTAEDLYAEVPDYDEVDPEWRETGDIEVYDMRPASVACIEYVPPLPFINPFLMAYPAIQV